MPRKRVGQDQEEEPRERAWELKESHDLPVREAKATTVTLDGSSGQCKSRASEEGRGKHQVFDTVRNVECRSMKTEKRKKGRAHTRKQLRFQVFIRVYFRLGFAIDEIGTTSH